MHIFFPHLLNTLIHKAARLLFGFSTSYGDGMSEQLCGCSTVGQGQPATCS